MVKPKLIFTFCLCTALAGSLSAQNYMTSVSIPVLAAGTEETQQGTEIYASFSNVSAKAGEPLNAVLANSTASDISYKWTVDGKSVSEKSASYTPSEDDYEKMITVTVTADGKNYTASMYFSELPVVYVNTENSQEISSKEEYISADCRIQGNEEFSNSDQLYNGSVSIRGRGNYTWEHPKKPYKIKLDDKTDVLGMGKNKHWVLIAEYVDPTHIRNEIMPELSEAIGMEYTAENQAVILVLNGEYQGLYHLSENIRISDERVNIYDWEEAAEDIAKGIYKANKSAGMTKDDRDDIEDYLVENLSWITERKFTWNGTEYCIDDFADIPTDTDGGYLLELDTYDAYHTEQVSDFETTGSQPVQFANPEYAKTNETIFNYARDYIQSFENAVSADDFYAELDGENKHYSQMFDMDSLVKYWMMLEVTSNSDGMRFSNFMYKDFGQLFKIGPAWDYDWTWNAGYTVPETEWWTSQSYYNETEHWYKYLVKDPYFITKAYELYHRISSSLYDVYKDGGSIDTHSEELKLSAEKDLSYWKDGVNYSSEISKTKKYVKSRYEWFETQFASVEKLAESLGYTASDKLSVTDISSENSTVTVTASVTDSSAVKAAFQVNGINAGTAEITGGKAVFDFSASMLETDAASLNTVQVRLLDSSGNYIKDKSGNSGGWNFMRPGASSNTKSTVSSVFKVFTAEEAGISKVSGDVNADGKTDTADLLMMQNYLYGTEALTDADAGDLNRDNTVNIQDLILMKNLLIKQ